MIRTVLVDDEVDSICVLRGLLETHCPEVDIVGQADGVETALEVIGECLPDLLFLDIAMNNENAFDLLNRLDPGSFQVIFVTAWDNHAIRAFKYSAVDYLLKPVDADELRKAVDKISQTSTEKGIEKHLKVLMDNINALQIVQQKMAVPTMSGLTFIYLKDILRLEAKSNCTAIFLSNGQRIVTARTIKEYETLLPEAIFYRVHNSHIINLGKVQKYHKGRGGSLIMEDGSAIEVAFRRREDFLSRVLK
jgi:two-component system LytT family response regulator